MSSVWYWTSQSVSQILYSLIPEMNIVFFFQAWEQLYVSALPDSPMSSSIKNLNFFVSARFWIWIILQQEKMKAELDITTGDKTQI